ncbi:hypothetical protein [Dysgonomonas sp. BGC7]|uniref:hypothetical protein n=1 Tax=Dysgonomonas sp. BGC7 TaxID=1658008 RepID=UPI000AE476FB|nr:hypothetical protein [Dysgonomonas sp. BGC7]MBD8389658.1 hypothetical protein [Dysgonomonas sp. BGC7]
MSKDTDKKGEVIKLNEKVTVYATDKSRHYKKGEEIKVHQVLADKLIAAGKATKESPKK